MNPNVLLLTVFIIFLIILYYIIRLFLGDKMLSENFEVDDDYYGLVDCEKYPYLCQLEYPIEYSDYIYNRPFPKRKLIMIEKAYNRMQRRKQRLA
jgi:hypothetical protein